MVCTKLTAELWIKDFGTTRFSTVQHLQLISRTCGRASVGRCRIKAESLGENRPGDEIVVIIGILGLVKGTKK